MPARPEPAPEPLLVIDDGGIASLIACLICPDPGVVTVWVPPSLPSAPAARLRAIRRHADLLGLREVIEPMPSAFQASSGSSSLADARMLLTAASEALRLGCKRLIWPVQVGDDFDALALAGDRARLISHLVCLESSEPEIVSASSPSPHRPPVRFRVETPLLDLTDPQIADLAQDLDAPLAACWNCNEDRESACGRCASCRRWAACFPIRAGATA